MFRPRKKLTKLSEGEVFKILAQDESKFVQVMRTIRNIDRDNNGYVTITELDDILKIQYSELQNKDIQTAIKKFRSIQNRILVDYKKFRDYVN